MASKVRSLKEKERISNIKNFEHELEVEDKNSSNERNKWSSKYVRKKNMHHGQNNPRAFLRKAFNELKLLLFLFIFFATFFSKISIC